MSEERPIAEVFAAMADAGWTVKNAHDKVLVKRFPDHRGGTNEWEIILNGNAERRTVKPRDWGEIDLPSFTAAVFWNGWLAGLLDPYGGVLTVGTGANEDALIASIRALPKVQA
jgi:hypothetical protein